MLKPSLAPLLVSFAMALSDCQAMALAGQAEPSLVDFSLEQLADIVVTSVSRRQTRLAEAPASVYVIGAADIRRAGAASLPEALRLAPNLQVARADAGSYAITARGFNSTIENKLLVLIDGRSVYSPLFSGVFWDMQDVVMEDIERIEIISGPGATIWGANAVNGVINIITRPAADTQGGLLVAGAGNQTRTGTLRHGGQLANGGHYRVYAQYNDAAGTDSEAGASAHNGWRRRQAGFRADWRRGVHDVTISGDAYQGALGGNGGPEVDIAGANLVARLNSRLEDGSELRLQSYLDHTERGGMRSGAQILDTLDLEAQHAIGIAERHQLVWGGGFRYSWDRISNGPLLRFTPAERNLCWGNVFAQDEITLRDALRLTAGIKLEHNSYTGLELLPNLRLAWTQEGDGLIWAGVSRTVRAPARIDRDLWVINTRSPPEAPRYSIAGGPDFESEIARVVELGYRGGAGALSYAATLFYSDYDKLRTLEPVAGQGAQFRNMGKGRVRGIETWGRWRVSDGWRLSGGMVLQRIRSALLPGSRDASGGTGLATNDPSHYWSLRSSHDLADSVQADFLLRRVGSLPQPAVPAYTELDLRMAWQPSRNVELSVTGQNLLHQSHPESGLPGSRQLVERAVLVKMALRF